MIEKLGRYEIGEEIGRGGFAIVYRAHDTRLDRMVALKELRSILLTNPDSAQSFRQEARNIARLDHPNVVTIYDLYEARQRLFLVMQLVDGSSLAELLASQGGLSWPRIVKIFTTVATGLDYAHARGILHRDLKPANILLDSNHGPMLSDFGLAKLIDEAGTSVTAAGGVVGTPHYIAPEVWEGQGTSPQSDIYGLGCILYEMLIGKKLFSGETPPAIMMAHFRALTLPDSWPEGVPAGVEQVLATALTKEPGDRYATAADMAKALTNLVEGEVVIPPLEPARSEPGAGAPPILATKLYIPPTRSDLVPRPRLIKRLNEGLHRKLTLVSAPAGFGKTTLVSEWVAGSKRPAAWLSLDKGDNDPARFLTYFIAALQQIDHTLGQTEQGMLASPQPPSPEALMTSLINEISVARNEFILVLDDYHVIEAKTVDQALSFLLEHLPPQMHLVIATREDPPLPLARYRVRDQLTELRVTDVRFTPAEAAGFLNQVMGLNLSAEEITALEQRTEGWIAGLQLAALSMQGHQDVTSFIKSFTGSHHFVLDYLVEEVLHQQSERVQSFLLRTSILNRLCGPLCDAILLDSSASGQETLEYLQQANLFLVPLDNERRWYRYHHLFADLLRQRLPQSPPSDPENGGQEVADLHLRASIWYEANGLEVEALHHAAAANDIDRAERLVGGGGMPLHFRGVVAPVLDWLESLPPTVLDARPSLWVMYASALSMAGQNSRVEEKLQAAEAALPGGEADDQTRNLIGHIAAMRALLAATQYQVDTIIAQSHRALEFLHPDNLPVRTATTWKLGLAYQFQGDRTAARQAYSKAIAISEASGNIFINILATTGLGIIQESENQLYLAADSYQRVLQLVGDPPQPTACEAYLGLARLYYEWNDLEAAQQHGQQSLKLAQQIENIDTPAACQVLLARLKLAQGDRASAATILAKADQFARHYNFEKQTPDIAAAQVLTLLQQGNLAATAQLAETHDLPLSRARLQLAQGEPAMALAALGPARQQAEAKGWADERLKVMVLEAVAHQAGGDKEKARHRLGEALSLAAPGGFIRIFVDEGPPMAALLSEAAARGLMPDYTNKLLAAFEAEKQRPADDTPPPAQPLIEPLSDRELEVLHLVAQGLSNREISERLFLALSTVKGHNRNIYGKLQVQRRTEAVARARELGLL